MSASARSLAAKVGAYTRAALYDGKEVTARARSTFRDSFLTAVDPEGLLDPSERERRAEALRRAHYARLALKRWKTESKKKSAAAATRNAQREEPHVPAPSG